MIKKSVNEGKKKVMLRQCEIVSNLDKFDFDYMVKVLEKKKKDAITHWAYIIHDKDTYDKDGERKDGSKFKKGELKGKHIHLMIKLKNPTPLHNIAMWFEVDEPQVEKIKAKWVSALRYLIHANHPEKHQYDVEEVKANFDYSAEKDKIGISKNAKQLRKEEIIENITNGNWKLKDIFQGEKINGVEYSEFSSSINSALLYRQKQLEIKSAGRDMKVIYVHGESGSGKTTLAKEYAENTGYDYYVSDGGKNPLDSYMGQDCVILDDFRPSKMEVGDLLKLLDNHTSSMASARYSNKYMGECKLIIITNVCDLETFFKGFQNTTNEPIRQLERRCSEQWKVSIDNVEFLYFDGEDYQTEAFVKNPLKGRKYAPSKRMGASSFVKAFGGEIETAGFC